MCICNDLEWWRRRELNPRPKARRRGTLHAYPLLLSRARREEAAKNRRVTSSGESRPPPPEHQRGTSLFNGVRPPTTRRGQGERHSLIRLRERTDCPQLTDVPSDLRVNGARHASQDPAPPSKPNSPPKVIALYPAGRSPRWYPSVRSFSRKCDEVGRNSPALCRLLPLRCL